jgi:hypothetical protein
MNNVSKIEHLLSHWIEHNLSHEEGYLKWIQRAEDAGRKDVAEELRGALKLSQKMSRRFEKAIKLLKGD